MKACRIGAAAFAAAIALAAGVPSAAAQTPPEGVLRCDVSGGLSFIFGSTRKLECVYAPPQGPTEYYDGRITKFGVDIGFLRSGVIVWGVIAPGIAGRTGALGGNYVGVSAQIAAGAGVGANALISGNKIMLNPISVEGTTGLNVAAGISGLALNYISQQPTIQRPLPVTPGQRR